MACIKAISYALPETILTNDELAQLYTGWTAEKIFEKTGIRQRHIAAERETAGDLAEQAARKLFEEYAITPEMIDFILFGTHSSDYFMPATACVLQNKLGIPTSAGALDFNLGCSAYIYGLTLAKALISTGDAKNVLFLTGETLTKHIHPMDKSTRTIFGDGAAATLVSASDEDKIFTAVHGTDGGGYDKLIIPAGAMRSPRSPETSREISDDSGNVRTLNNFYMDGADVFNFTLEKVPDVVQKTLIKNNLEMGQIDLFVFHQANKFMLESLRKVIRIPREKFYMNMEDVGNTVSSTIPIALCRAQQAGVLKSGMKVMLVGFGVGLSWGAVVVEWI